MKIKHVSLRRGMFQNGCAAPADAIVEVGGAPGTQPGTDAGDEKKEDCLSLFRSGGHSLLKAGLPEAKGEAERLTIKPTSPPWLPDRTMLFTKLNDKELVAQSVGGDVAAFKEIAARYYPLIRSLAFSATGSLHQSDDLAQETFVTAWKHLAGLKHPAKLSSWLCGIACRVIDKALASQFLNHYTHENKNITPKTAATVA